MPHLENVHKNEKDVKAFKSLPPGEYISVITIIIITMMTSSFESITACTSAELYNTEELF